jgi:hypothetical protein
MRKPFSRTTRISRPVGVVRLVRFVIAAMIYVLFAVYLYQPYFRNFAGVQYFLPVNVCVAALGGYILSRRWVAGFVGSFFTGTLYGFGPFMLCLSRFHPVAGSLIAVIPWLFWPAAYIGRTRTRWLSAPLAALPFVAIMLFFWISAQYRFFAVPVQTKVHLIDIASLVAPLVLAERSSVLISFYHVPMAALFTGLSMLVAGRRIGIITVVVLGIVLAYGCFVSVVSPVIWLCIPILISSVSIGVGMQGLIYAGYADRIWIIFATMVLGTLAIVTLLLATKYFQVFLGLGANCAKLFVQSAKMYVLGGIATVFVFFIVHAKLRVHWLRWSILCGAMGIDVFFSARLIVDKSF